MSQILKKWIGSNQVGGAQFRLENATMLRARNAADSADINLFQITSGDSWRFESSFRPANDNTLNIGTSSFKWSTVYALNVDSGASGLGLHSGNGTSSSDVSLYSGSGSAGNTGNANVTTGNSTGGNSGNLLFTTGTATGSRGFMSVDAAWATFACSIFPSSDNTKDIGSSSARFASLYAINVNSGSSDLTLRSANQVGATASNNIWLVGGDTVNGNSGMVGVGSGGPTGSGTSGALLLWTGGSATGATGGIQIYSGNTSAGLANTGDVSMVSGNSFGGNSGNITIQTGTAGGTRGNVTVSGNSISLNSATTVDLNNKKIINLADPTVNQDAATKKYVDDQVAAFSGNFSYKSPVRYATNAALPAYTPAGSGVGKTLTANANGALSVDGFTPAVTNRILVKNEGGGTSSQNGIYTVTQVGDGSNPWILTRATDFDQNSEVVAGSFIISQEGTANADKAWLLTTNNPITVDTTALTFQNFGTITLPTWARETFTLSAGDITNKYVTLANAPTGASVSVIVKGSGSQLQGDDWIVSGSNIDWNGLGLDGVLAAGDKVQIQYQY